MAPSGHRYPAITLTGADGLIELVRTLTEKQLLPAINKGMRAVGSKTMRDARKHLRKGHGLDTGQLRKSLGVRKIMTIKKEGKVLMYLGPRRKFAITHPVTKKKHDPFFIGHLVEFGHRIAVGKSGRGEKGVRFERVSQKTGNVYRTGTAVSGGIVKGKPFLRPAVDANKSEFNRQMAAKIRDVLTKARASGK
jgi:hypothetical protein